MVEVTSRVVKDRGSARLGTNGVADCVAGEESILEGHDPGTGGFVKGHGFSRAVSSTKDAGFSP